MSTTTAKRSSSGFFFWLSFTAAALTLFASASLFNDLTRGSEGWGTMVFTHFIVPFLGGGTALFCVIPSTILYFRSRQRGDLVTLWISSASVGIILVEWILLFLLRGR